MGGVAVILVADAVGVVGAPAVLGDAAVGDVGVAARDLGLDGAGLGRLRGARLVGCVKCR